MEKHGQLQIASGTTIGRDHRLAFRNCQDAVSVARTDEYTIGLVADGCGSSPYSEVGAQLGVRIVGQAIQAEIRRRQGTVSWQRVQQHLLASLDVLARQLGGEYRRTVEEYLLFTLVGVVLTGEQATFFALGDGIIIVNGTQYDLGPFPGNMPPYIGYGLISDEIRLDPAALQLRPVIELPLTNLDHFLVGCDGVMDLIGAADKTLPGLDQPVGDIAQFWEDDRYFRGNPELVSRRLRQLSRDWPRRNPEPGILSDDTTLIVGRWPTSEF